MVNNVIDNVCKIGQGKNCCKYLIFSQNGFSCAKFRESTKKLIDNNWNPDKIAQGDNCDGLSDANFK